ncbi:unnamed protein product [Arabis nemorensis]|uniref:Uncharacterized protein n=1 Tax=Arabis nemorensis TaxID=586526 RepID=A0A565BCJ4_9BRAS|nr:unnamed protein product [Arabis nemorensis]
MLLLLLLWNGFLVNMIMIEAGVEGGDGHNILLSWFFVEIEIDEGRDEEESDVGEFGHGYSNHWNPPEFVSNLLVLKDARNQN